jgi:hypothetical protein
VRQGRKRKGEGGLKEGRVRGESKKGMDERKGVMVERREGEDSEGVRGAVR